MTYRGGDRKLVLTSNWGGKRGYMTLTEMSQLLANGGTLAVLMYFMFVKSDAQSQAIGKLTTAVEKLNILLQSKEDEGEN